MTDLTWRIVSGSVDLDVTDKVRDTPTTSWVALGGFELANVRIDLPATTFPDLDEQSRLIVTDANARIVWEGYCTDPGGTDTDDGQAFELLAGGAMVLASDKVEPLVYRDTLHTSWTRAAASVESGQAATFDDTTGTGWLIAHPQGYPIGTGAEVGIEYRQLQHGTQGIGAVEFTTQAGAADTGFTLRVTTYADDVEVDTIDLPLSTTATAHTLVAGTDIASGTDTITLTLVRVSGATNVTTGLSWVRLTGLAVNGSRLDRFGATIDPASPVTSASVINDLIGRGMLAQVDPARADVADSAALHTQLAFPEGARATTVITKVRDTDPDMVWMYGPRGTGGTTEAPAGHEFTWARWPETEVRYNLTEDDAITRPGAEDQRAHRISVFYRDTEAGPLKRLVVALANPGGDRLRDADPINLPDVATELDAQAAGEAALERLSATKAATATVGRLITDQRTGYKVEPWEIRPGSLARIEATGELLRVTEVSCAFGDGGARATLTLGDPAKTLDDKLLSFFRGESDPTAPLITLPAPVSSPPVVGTPANSDGLPPTESPDLTWRAGIGSVFLSWEPVANADTVTYRILIGISPTLTESPSTLAGTATGGFFIARQLPNGTPFQNDTTYYARAIAQDADGDAPAGDVVSGQVIAKITQTEISDGAVNTPQLNANAITTDLLLANDAWIGALRATDFYGEDIVGPIIRSATSGQRMEMRADVSGGIIYGYTGAALETGPAYIDPSGVTYPSGYGGGIGTLELASPDLGWGRAKVILKSPRSDGVPFPTHSALRVDFEGNSNLCPIGTIVMWTASASPPDGWMLCDGSAVPSTYALRSLMTTTPNLVGKFPFGAGGSVARNASGGGTSPSITGGTTNSTAASGSTNTAGSHFHSGNTAAADLTQVDNTQTGGSNNRLTGPSSHAHSLFTDNSGSHSHTFNDGGHTHTFDTPPVSYYGVVFIIRAYW